MSRFDRNAIRERIRKEQALTDGKGEFTWKALEEMFEKDFGLKPNMQIVNKVMGYGKTENMSEELSK